MLSADCSRPSGPERRIARSRARRPSRRRKWAEQLSARALTPTVSFRFFPSWTRRLWLVGVTGVDADPDRDPSPVPRGPDRDFVPGHQDRDRLPPAVTRRVASSARRRIAAARVFFGRRAFRFGAVGRRAVADDPVDDFVAGDDVEAATGVFAEGDRRADLAAARRLDVFGAVVGGFAHPVARQLQRADPARAEVGVDVAAVEAAEAFVADDVAAGDRAAVKAASRRFGVRVVPDQVR